MLAFLLANVVLSSPPVWQGDVDPDLRAKYLERGLDPMLLALYSRDDRMRMSRGAYELEQELMVQREAEQEKKKEFGYRGDKDRPLLDQNRQNHENNPLASAKKEQKQKKSVGEIFKDSVKKHEATMAKLHCCEEQKVECKACRAHKPVKLYCRQNPMVPGCAEVRQQAVIAV